VYLCLCAVGAVGAVGAVSGGCVIVSGGCVTVWLCVIVGLWMLYGMRLVGVCVSECLYVRISLTVCYGCVVAVCTNILDLL
jgi:hypothetical protein